MTSTKIHLCLLAAALLALSPWTARASITRQVDKTFVVQPGGTLTVSTEGGDVRVTTGGGPTVKVTAVEKIRASSEAEADKLLQKLNLTVESSGTGVAATAKYGERRAWFHFGSWPPVEVSFIIAVPENYNASIRTSGGDIIIGDLDGRVEAKTSGGDIKVGKIGGEVTATTSGGGIEVAAAGGPARLSSSGGDIKAGRLNGPADVKTSGGDIKIEAAEGTVIAATSGGDVRVGWRGPLPGASTLRTSGGDIDVVLTGRTACTLDAATSGGAVEVHGVKVTIEHGAVGKGRLEGTVNGGGPVLKLRTSGGDIELRGPGGE